LDREWTERTGGPWNGNRRSGRDVLGLGMDRADRRARERGLKDLTGWPGIRDGRSRWRGLGTGD